MGGHARSSAGGEAMSKPYTPKQEMKSVLQGLLAINGELRAENARLREALEETCNALDAAPPFNYARSGSLGKSSKQTLKQARAALEVKP